jgi:hypothetical protein
MKYQLFDNLPDDEYEALKESIKLHGVQIPVVFDDTGAILDGHQRHRICAELGIEEYPRIIREGMSEDEKRAYVRALNLARRHLTQEQRRAVVSAQLKETPDRSDRQIAVCLGVDHKTVGAVRKGMEERGEIPHVPILTDTKGRKQPRERSVGTDFKPAEQAVQEQAAVLPDESQPEALHGISGDSAQPGVPLPEPESGDEPVPTEDDEAATEMVAEVAPVRKMMAAGPQDDEAGPASVIEVGLEKVQEVLAPYTGSEKEQIVLRLLPEQPAEMVRSLLSVFSVTQLVEAIEPWVPAEQRSEAVRLLRGVANRLWSRRSAGSRAEQT